MHEFPNPDTEYPLRTSDREAHAGTVFLKPVLDHPRIEVGEYSYASAHIPPAVRAADLAMLEAANQQT